MKMVLFSFLLGCCSLLVSAQQPVDYVNPFIGTSNYGTTNPGAICPQGMMSVTPFNVMGSKSNKFDKDSQWWSTPYSADNNFFTGYAHVNLSGVGCPEMGSLLLMPTSGELNVDYHEYGSEYKNEVAHPGYYSNILTKYNIKTEATASMRTGLTRFTFPKGQGNILLNLGEGLTNETGATVRMVSDTEIEGSKLLGTFCYNPQAVFPIYFVMKLSKAPKQAGYWKKQREMKGVEAEWDAYSGKYKLYTKYDREMSGDDIGVWFKYDTEEDEVIEVKMGVSFVSIENARLNMNTEQPDFNFDKVRAAAGKMWNDDLSRVMVEGGTNDDKTIFYTAMYHAFIAPTLYCDANGDFRGHDDKVYTNNTWKNYSTFSLWDTYRTLHPLFTIIKPQYVSDLVNSMLSIYDQQEKLPIWPLIGGETDQMPGYSAVPIIADAYLKGFTGFDADRAYRYMVASSVYEKQNGVPYVLEKGYIPCDKVREATSIAMEYAADDWGIALMAKKMGKTEDYQNYLKRGKYYTQYFDKDINFIRPKMNDGSWRTPYDPIQSIHSVGDFCEGNGWHYTFFVPQHPEGLIELMGGDAPFISKLDSLFLVEGELGENASPDISGLIGMYAHGNEPSHHVTYLYPYAGEQWKTAEKVRYIQDVFYTDQPEGIIGNEDCGQMSAWHIMSALGFYQVNPSNGVFVFGSPLFDKASVHLPEGKTFEVVAQNNSKENVYIQSVLLNGKPYNNSYILYDDIVKGGNLTFVMGSTPNKEFGAAPENRPKTAE